MRHELGPANGSAAVVEEERGDGVMLSSMGCSGEGHQGARGYASVACKMLGAYDGALGCTILWHDSQMHGKGRRDEGQGTYLECGWESG